MAGLVDTEEAEIAVFAHLAVLVAVDGEGHVAGLGELARVSEVELVGDGFAAEPVADVVGVAVEEADADAVVDNYLEVFDEDRVGEVAGARKCIENVIVGHSVVKVYAKGLLNLGLVEVVDEIFRWRWVFVRMADIVDTTPAIFVIRLFGVGAALIDCLGA